MRVDRRGVFRAATTRFAVIRLAIGGADSDHYGQVPYRRPPLVTISRAGSYIDLPLTIAP